MTIVSAYALAMFFYSDIPREKTFTVEGPKINNAEIGSFVGREVVSINNCENSNRRAIGVMMTGDEEARPLSGISFADIVVEVPVVTGSITRMLAIFICQDPGEIGSVRSARHDFIPLAQGFDAILVHWGGSYLAQEELKKKIIDNLDALPNYYETFYRKVDFIAPHDGFTSMEKMVNASENLGYRMTTNFAGYKFLADKQSVEAQEQTLEIEYLYPYNVRYEYKPKTNTYLRWRGELREIDTLNKTQVSTENIVIMRTNSRQIGGGYNDVDVLGSGDAVVYRNGEEVRGVWVKEDPEDVLRFYDRMGEEISFAPGKIWIEVVEPDTVIVYE